LYYDMFNTKKSYNGQPTTNQFGIPTPDSSGNVTFPVQGTGTFQRIYSGTYGGYTIQSTDIVYKYVLGAAPTGCHYHGNTISISTGQIPTWSFDYYIDSSTTGYPVTNYLANMESSIGVGLALTDPTPTSIGVWKRATGTSAAATANGTFNAYLYPGACGTQMATGGFILYKNPQVEYNSYATPFTTGTRSSSTAVTDLMGIQTSNLNNVVYSSDNTYSFNGSTTFMSSSNTGLTHGTSDWTYSAWASWASLPGLGTLFENGVWTSCLLIRYESSGFTIYSMGTGWGTLSFTPTLNTWYNVTFVRSGSNIYLYVNGVLTATITSFTANIAPSNSTMYIGMSQHSPGQCFNGKIGVAQVYNRALSAGEVLQNFVAERSRFGI
jgi:hypothetical protein